jgi:hypothetical protein
MSEEGSSLESVAHAVTEVDEGSVFAECDGNNQGCFDADCQGDDGDTDTSDPCWCTHCDNGNYCADYDEHQENDDDCTLTSS